MNSSGYYDIVSIVVDMGKMYIATTEGLAISNRVCNYGQCKTVFKQVKLFPAADYQPINALAISGGAIYAGTGFGLFISRDKDSGVFFGPVYLSDHLASNDVQSIAVVGNNIYLGTALGFFISTDGGFSFRKVEVADKLASANIHSIVVQGNNIYLGTGDGLFVSNDSAKSFRLVTVANGLGANEVKSVGIVGGNIYVGTEQKGLSISGNSGNSFNAIPYIDAVE
jgi:ligand-binding sensor domain-containing protein